MNAKGDAPYDFTCNSSHQCQNCKKYVRMFSNEKTNRDAKKQAQKNKKDVSQALQKYRNKYFKGQPGCGCTKEQMCQKCLSKLQADVTKYEKGCGKTWEEQFGGMAAGPAWVTCSDNYFLCQNCSQPLAFIKSLNKEYPHVKLDHMPQIQKMFWSPRNYPYYQGLI